jgi:hypothetical protein
MNQFRRNQHFSLKIWKGSIETVVPEYLLFSIVKKSLKIPKEQSETVYRRRTDNTMAKRKSTKGQTTIYKTYI